MATQSILELHAVGNAQKQFAAAEKAVFDCEQSLAQGLLSEDNCAIHQISRHLWKITSKQIPGVEVHVYVHHDHREVHRLNWRQRFE